MVSTCFISRTARFHQKGIQRIRAIELLNPLLGCSTFAILVWNGWIIAGIWLPSLSGWVVSAFCQKEIPSYPLLLLW